MLQHLLSLKARAGTHWDVGPKSLCGRAGTLGLIFPPVGEDRSPTLLAAEGPMGCAQLLLLSKPLKGHHTRKIMERQKV